jgi:hypothetical protein
MEKQIGNWILYFRKDNNRLYLGALMAYNKARVVRFRPLRKRIYVPAETHIWAYFGPFTLGVRNVQ